MWTLRETIILGLTIAVGAAAIIGMTTGLLSIRDALVPPAHSATMDAPAIEAPLGTTITTVWYVDARGTTRQPSCVLVTDEPSMRDAFLLVLTGKMTIDAFLSHAAEFGSNYAEAAGNLVLACGIGMGQES